MSQKFRLPGINAPTDREKIAQIHSYLYQLANQLNFVMDNLPVADGAARQEDDYVLFARLRPLIMRSKEVADAYREQLKTTFATKEELAQISCLYKKTLQITNAGNLVVEGDAGADSQLFWVAGCASGAAVNGTISLFADGALFQRGTISFVSDSGGKFHRSMLAGDRLIILSDRAFEATIS